MRLTDLIKHLKKEGCFLVREGGSHTIYNNPNNKKNVPVPRHREIKNMLAKKICQQLEIDPPSKF